jgi:hypothetical protein
MTMKRASLPGLVPAARFSATVLVAVSAAALATAPAAAQDAVPAPIPAPVPGPAPDPTPEPSPSPRGGAPRVQVTGFVDVYYEYNFNGVDPSLRVFDVQHNAFSLSLAEVALAKTPTTDSRVGFRADIDLGKTADIVASFEPEREDREIYKYIQQAYVSVLAGSRVQIDAGKFVTPHGAEVIESQDDWNYTRSILFGYAIPFYHFGLRAQVPLNDRLSVSGYVVNGWNNGAELDGSKAFAVGGTLKPSGSLTWVGNYMVGKEAEGLDTRHLFDTTLTLAATSRLSVMGNFDYGKEGPVTWWGIAAYAKYQAAPSWSLVGRFEYVDDTKGGFMTFGTTARSVTVTSDHTIAGALKARLECRTDFADEAIFPKDDGSTQKSQTTLTVGLVYTFGGSF